MEAGRESSKGVPTAPRFRELDGLRGFASLAVVVYHLTGFTYENPAFDDANRAAFHFAFGEYGVQLFFMISGFVILMSARGARRPSDFALGRFARLYPVYWLSIAVAVILLRLGPPLPFPSDAPTVLVNLTMMQRWLQVPNVVDVYWTLGIELQFYALVLALLLLTRCRLGDRLMAVVCVAWSVVAWAVALTVFPHTQGIPPQRVETPIKMLLNITLAEYGTLFIAGMATHLARQRGGVQWWLAPALVSPVAITFLLRGREVGWPVLAMTVIFAVTALRPRTALMLLPPVQWLGRISYSLYIFHSIPGYLVILALHRSIGADLAILVALGVVLVISWTAHVWVEDRLSRAVRRALRSRWRALRPSSPFAQPRMGADAVAR